MKKSSVFAALLAATLLLGALAAGCSADSADSSAKGQASATTAGGHWADALRPVNLEEVQKRIAEAKGKAVLVCLWSVNCPACVQEMPVLEQLADEYSRDDLEILLLNLDMDKNLVKHFFKDYTPQSTVLLAEPAVGDALRAAYIPKLLVYDAKGEIAFEDAGFYPKAMLSALIERAKAAK